MKSFERKWVFFWGDAGICRAKLHWSWCEAFEAENLKQLNQKKLKKRNYSKHPMGRKAHKSVTKTSFFMQNLEINAKSLMRIHVFPNKFLRLHYSYFLKFTVRFELWGVKSISEFSGKLFQKQSKSNFSQNLFLIKGFRKRYKSRFLFVRSRRFRISVD